MLVLLKAAGVLKLKPYSLKRISQAASAVITGFLKAANNTVDRLLKELKMV
jgi:hypothetical protein